jgi:outer membrane lipoprotein-sorting protein
MKVMAGHLFGCFHLPLPFTSSHYFGSSLAKIKRLVNGIQDFSYKILVLNESHGRSSLRMFSLAASLLPAATSEVAWQRLKGL